MGLEAATKALLDAGEYRSGSLENFLLVCSRDANLTNLPGITYDAIETAIVGYCYGDSTSGHFLILSPISIKPSRRPACPLQPRSHLHSDNQC